MVGFDVCRCYVCSSMTQQVHDSISSRLLRAVVLVKNKVDGDIWFLIPRSVLP